MNANEILDQYTEAGIDAIAVVTTLAAYEQAKTDYPTRCAQTPVIAATIDSKTMTGAALAAATGVTAMTITRYASAGRILIAHPELDAVAVVQYANTHTVKEGKAVAAMSDEDAEAAINPPKDSGKTPKTLVQKLQEAQLKMSRLMLQAAEEGLRDVVEACDTAHTDAIASAYAVLDGEAVEDLEEIA